MANSFLETVRALLENFHDAEEKYRVSLRDLAQEIVTNRIDSGEASSSERIAGLISLGESLASPRSRHANASAEILEGREQSKAKLRNAYREVAGTIYTMKTGELLKLIERLRRDVLLIRVLSSLPKKRIGDLYSMAPPETSERPS